MFTSLKLRGVALIATVALLGGTAMIASGATGAYFSETHTGTVTGSTGSIHVDTGASGGTGGDSLDFDLSNLLPGEPQSMTVRYTNSGLNPEDVWIVFDPTALGFLNNAGTNATVSITSTGGFSFTSSDMSTTPVPASIKVRSNLAPGSHGRTDGSFGIAASVSDPAAEGLSSFGGIPLALPYEVVATQVGVAPGA